VHSANYIAVHLRIFWPVGLVLANPTYPVIPESPESPSRLRTVRTALSGQPCAPNIRIIHTIYKGLHQCEREEFSKHPSAHDVGGMCGVWIVHDSWPWPERVAGSCSTPVRHIHEFLTRILVGILIAR
jgi:hypothetical protein